MEENICPLCRKHGNTHLSTDYDGYTIVECNTCGRFLIDESVLTSYDVACLVSPKANPNSMILNPKIRMMRCNSIYEFLLRKPYFHDIMGMAQPYRFFYKKEYNVEETLHPLEINVARLIIDYPKNVGEKLDKILMNFAIMFPQAGAQIIVDDVPNVSMYVEYSSDEKDAYNSYLGELGYFDTKSCKLTAKGWARIAELTSKQHEVNQGFIAMSFRPETKEISDSFKSAIVACGYAPKRIDEKEHNNQIVPEILYEIEQSKFVVVDVTYQNNGAYYEAGYAQALGKQVIICCREAEFNDANKRPHFDISQKSMIVWKDKADLIERLKKRIEVTVGINN